MSSSTCMADGRNGMVRAIKMTGLPIQFDWHKPPLGEGRNLATLVVVERFTRVPVRRRADLQGSSLREDDERAMCRGKLPQK